MSFTIDRNSLLVEVPGAATLAAIEAALAVHGLTLGLPGAREVSVGAWLAEGAPGAPSTFLDPADHLVAGLRATLHDGRTFAIRPAPRRSVGPDLAALVLGAGERFATIDHVWLRVHLVDATRPALPGPRTDLDAPLSAGESALVEAIGRELARG